MAYLRLYLCILYNSENHMTNFGTASINSSSKSFSTENEMI